MIFANTNKYSSLFYTLVKLMKYHSYFIGLQRLRYSMPATIEPRFPNDGETSRCKRASYQNSTTEKRKRKTVIRLLEFSTCMKWFISN